MRGNAGFFRCGSLRASRWRRSSGVDQDARVQDAARVERAFRGPKGHSERLRTLAVVAGPVVTTDGMVVRDGAAPAPDRLVRGRLDLRPLLELAAGAGWREHAVVRRRPIRVRVREA